MPKLIRWQSGVAAWAEDPFTAVDDDQSLPRGEVIVSLARFQREGRDLLAGGRGLGVRLESDDAPEALILDLPQLEVVALTFPKYRDGRAYSAARVLRERLGFRGELRAVGDVLLEMGHLLVRCGFDTVEPADDTTPEQWTRVARRYRHVYQRAADGREPAFAERVRV
ncbi:MAG: hypothetical protein JWO83_4240 [Caulobacteraceae bacterium]|nr:hypothetical protein [Caulobacteraceae bacterium]